MLRLFNPFRSLIKATMCRRGRSEMLRCFRTSLSIKVIVLCDDWVNRVTKSYVYWKEGKGTWRIFCQRERIRGGSARAPSSVPSQKSFAFFLVDFVAKLKF